MHVKNTDRIWSEIRSKITALYDKREERAKDLFIHGLNKDEMEAKIKAGIFPGDTAQKIAELGERYFVKSNVAYVKLCYGPGFARRHLYELQFSESTLMPSSWTTTYNSTVYVEDDEISAALTRRADRIDAVTNERNNFIEETRKAYYAVTSINQLIKVWPAVQELLPADVIERLNRKVERAKPEAVVIESAQKLSATLLMARVAA